MRCLFERILTAVVCSIVLSTSAAYAKNSYQHLYNNPAAQAAFIKRKIREHFPPEAAEAMIKVANCESTGLIHWLPDGSLKKNIPKKGEKPTSARGVLQVLFKLHKPDYERMGLNMHNIDDYMRYARHLYDTQGPKNAWEECVVQMPKSVVAMLK